MRRTDDDDPIRVPEIRGHLRFWWRATMGAQFDSCESMFQREQEIWGGIDKEGGKASQVQITLMSYSGGVKTRAAVHEVSQRTRKTQSVPNWKRGEGPGYVLFPLRNEDVKDKTVEVDTGPVRIGSLDKPLSFEIDLQFPAHLNEDIRTAFQAWILLGGIGGRTRRGCGTFLCSSISDSISDIDILPVLENENNTFKLNVPFLEQFKTNPVLTRSWPILQNFKLLYHPKHCSKAREAWEDAIYVLFKFRQGDNIGRRENFHQSYWPEPMSLRELGTRSKLVTRTNWFRKVKEEKHVHNPPTGTPVYFPRTEFGMPILFKFMGPGTDERANATVNVFKGEDELRLSSPVILKALPVKVGDKIEYIPIIVLMNTTLARDLTDVQVLVKNQEYSHRLLRNEIHNSSITIPSGTSGVSLTNPGALEAFFDYAITQNKYRRF